MLVEAPLRGDVGILSILTMASFSMYLFAFCAIGHQSMWVQGHRYVDVAEHECRNHYEFGKNNCATMKSDMPNKPHVFRHPCACLLDQIKCYDKNDCNAAIFDVDSADCMINDPSIFTFNCAQFSNALRQQNNEAALAWVFCIFILLCLAVYFAIVVRNRDSTRVTGDSCIVGVAFLFTILICFVWIDSTASLLFVLIYVVVSIFIFFACFYGSSIDYDPEPADGSQEPLQPAETKTYV